MANKRKSVIWLFFTLGENTKFAKCNTCKEMVDRGGKSTKAFTPTNLVNHLKKHHKKEFENYEKKKAGNKLKISISYIYWLLLALQISYISKCKNSDINTTLILTL